MGPNFKAADQSDVDLLLGLRRAFCRHEHLHPPAPPARGPDVSLGKRGGPVSPDSPCWCAPGRALSF
jgi:hypothetical protein